MFHNFEIGRKDFLLSCRWISAAPDRVAVAHRSVSCRQGERTLFYDKVGHCESIFHCEYFAGPRCVRILAKIIRCRARMMIGMTISIVCVTWKQSRFTVLMILKIMDVCHSYNLPKQVSSVLL